METKISMKINIFLIKTIESLGKYDSLEEDLVDFFLEIIKNLILNNIKESIKMNDPSNSEKELKKKDEILFNLFLKLTILKSQYSENRKYIIRLKQQVPKFSTILSNILKISNNEIQGRIEELKSYKESIKVFNDYYKIQQELLKISSSS